MTAAHVNHSAFQREARHDCEVPAPYAAPVTQSVRNLQLEVHVIRASQRKAAEIRGFRRIYMGVFYAGVYATTCIHVTTYGV